MQDRYAGDIGDFAKLGLLRHLSLYFPWPLGVNWYRYPNENHNRDGRHIQYLSLERFTECDPILIKGLRYIVQEDYRNCTALEASKLLPVNTEYFGDMLDFHKSQNKPNWTCLRRTWHEKSLERLITSRWVFLDPDNGLAKDSMARTGKKAGKYVFADELRDYCFIKDVVIFYHHFNRQTTHQQQIDEMLARVTALTPEKRCVALRFRAYSPRAFIIIYDRHLWETLEDAINAFLSSSWHAHWDVCWGKTKH